MVLEVLLGLVASLNHDVGSTLTEEALLASSKVFDYLSVGTVSSLLKPLADSLLEGSFLLGWKMNLLETRLLISLISWSTRRLGVGNLLSLGNLGGVYLRGDLSSVDAGVVLALSRFGGRGRVGMGRIRRVRGDVGEGFETSLNIEKINITVY